jgi:UDP-N-acetylmuramoyl-tripeptide--D-alanyl-D-alanine ligase
LPLTLFRLQAEHQWAVLEMGTSSLGEVERLTEIAQPTIGVITNVGPAHLETLHGLDGVSRAKGELFAGLQGGTAVINLDDERVARLPVANGVGKLTYGESPQAQVRAEQVQVAAASVRFELVFDNKRESVCLQVPGRHNVANALAAAAAALVVNVPLVKIAAGLNRFVPIRGRMNLCPLACGGLLLDDSYNSNPLSVAAALDGLKEQKGQGRRVAVLGDMLELGEDTVQLHREAGARAAEVVDLLVAVGEYADLLCAGAQTAGLPAEQSIQLADVAAAIGYLQQNQRPGDRILVKGSRGIKLDKLATALRAAGEELPHGQKGS